MESTESKQEFREKHSLSMKNEPNELFNEYLSPQFGEKFSSVNIKEAVTVIKRGSWMIRQRRRPFWGTVTSRVFLRVDMESLNLIWSREKLSAIKTKSLSLKRVEKIVPGENRKSFKKKGNIDKTFCISIVSKRRLDTFICESFSEWTVWLRGLSYVLHKSRIKQADVFLNSTENIVLRQFWEQGNTDDTGTIQFHEIISLLKSIKYDGNVYCVSHAFYRSIKDASNVLEYSEFVSVILSLLTKDAVKDDFIKYCSGGQAKALMSFDDFIIFLRTSQGASHKEIEDTMNIVQNYPIPFATTNCLALAKPLQNRLTFMGFCRYITSYENSIFSVDKLRQYQPMNYPIHHYWIRTLYQWFFYRDTVTFALWRLRAGLENGHRAVVIPVYINDEKRAVCLNSSFLCKSKETLYFQDVLNTIVKFAFKSGNPFPVILIILLSNRNHEEKVGSILSQCLKDRLKPCPYVDSSQSRHTSSCVSPESLKNSFLALKLFHPNYKNHFIDEAPWNSGGLEHWESTMEGEDSILSVSDCSVHDAIEDSTVRPTEKEDATWTTCTYVDPHNNQIERSMSGHFAIGEEHLQNVSLDDHASQALHNALKKKPSICLMLPEGDSILCSVPDPTLAWSYGIQMVGTPHSASGLGNLLIDARFAENGNCGYICKPMRTKDNFLSTSWLESPMRLSVTVLAGQELPRHDVSSSFIRGAKDTMSPYVTVSLHGIISNRILKKTALVPGNGLNPCWPPTTFSFDVVAPSVSFLVFEILNFHRIKVTSVASVAIPVTCIRSGLKWVPLKTIGYQACASSGLLVRVLTQYKN